MTSGICAGAAIHSALDLWLSHTCLAKVRGQVSGPNQWHWLCALRPERGGLIPGLSLQSAIISLRPRHSCPGRSGRILEQADRQTPPLRSSALSIRAMRFASAVAATLAGFFARIRPGQPLFSPAFRCAEITLLARKECRRLRARLSIFEIKPTRCLPPLECGFGASPSHAGRSALSDD